MRSPKLTSVSLFSGAGGLDYGFEAAGFQTRLCVEIDALCATTLKDNRKWPIIQQDIASVSSEAVLKAARLQPGQVDILIGGPPCQPFSKAGFWHSGEAKRLSDPRASTLDHYLRLLEAIQPRAFLIENVEGLGFSGKDEGVDHIRRSLKIINERSGTGYSFNLKVVNAADYGVPQHRRRLFIIGSRDGKSFSFPEPTHVDPSIPGKDLRPTWATAWDALWDLADPNEDLRLRGKWADLLPSIPEGSNYLWHTERGGGEPLFGWRRRFWSFLLKLSKDQPSWTIAAQPGPATGPFHWNNRRLSVHELCRLQTFPEGVQIAGGLSDVQRQLGNAVPSLLAEVLARAVATQLLGAKRDQPPILCIDPAPATAPPPGPVRPVAEKYMPLRGSHSAHPGTGRGFAAAQRVEAP